MAALRAGDERVFEQLVRMYQGTLLRVAQMYVSSRAVAEEVVQETWLAVLNGIDRFEGRSSLKTWIFRILANRAKTRGERERRTVPFSALGADDAEPAVDPTASGRTAVAAGLGLAAAAVDRPEERLLGERRSSVSTPRSRPCPRAARGDHPARRRGLRPPRRSCEVLELTEVNQRVLLHRARSKVRARSRSTSRRTMTETIEQLAVRSSSIVTDYLEDALPPESAPIRAHIVPCDGCATTSSRSATTIELTGRLTPEQLDPEAEAALLGAFRDWHSR